MTKAELRTYIRALKRNCPKEQLALLSDEISDSVLAEQRVCAASCIMAYFPLPDEVTITPVIRALASQGKTVLLPEVVSDTEMVLRKYQSDNDLREGAFGILEPTGELFTEYEKIDLVIVPGMAFDKSGNRLGHGKGYYDRFFAEMERRTGRLPYLMGVAFPFQVIDEIPYNEHDKKMDKVLTL